MPVEEMLGLMLVVADLCPLTALEGKSDTLRPGHWPVHAAWGSMLSGRVRGIDVAFTQNIQFDGASCRRRHGDPGRNTTEVNTTRLF